MQTEKRGNRIAVLIPCYNEALTIGNVVRDYRQALPDADIYVYDNNSTDETARLAREAGAIVRPEPRQGKGNVVRTMFRDIEADCYLMVVYTVILHIFMELWNLQRDRGWTKYMFTASLTDVIHLRHLEKNMLNS